MADSLLLYKGADTSSNRLVTPLNFLTLNLAPKFGAVILIHKEPVGLGLASVDLYNGTCVWEAVVTCGM